MKSLKINLTETVYADLEEIAKSENRKVSNAAETILRERLGDLKRKHVQLSEIKTALDELCHAINNTSLKHYQKSDLDKAFTTIKEMINSNARII